MNIRGIIFALLMTITFGVTAQWETIPSDAVMPRWQEVVPNVAETDLIDVTTNEPFTLIVNGKIMNIEKNEGNNYFKR